MNEKDLKNILLLARKKKRLTQKDVVLLSEASITRQYYGMIENGERKPSVNTAKAISEVLGVDWTIFFDDGSNQKLPICK